jgi:hypothetical protein
MKSKASLRKVPEIYIEEFDSKTLCTEFSINEKQIG